MFQLISFTKPFVCKKILPLVFFVLGCFQLNAQNLRSFIFPKGITSSRFNYLNGSGDPEEGSKMVFEYLMNDKNYPIAFSIGDNDVMIFISNYQNDVLLSRKREDYFVTDTAIYLININKEALSSSKREGFLGYNNCFLKMPYQGTATSWIYKESNTTSYKCRATLISIIMGDSTYATIKVEKTPFENGHYLNELKTNVYYVQGKGLLKEVFFSTKKDIYILNTTEFVNFSN